MLAVTEIWQNFYPLNKNIWNCPEKSTEKLTVADLSQSYTLSQAALLWGFVWEIIFLLQIHFFWSHETTTVINESVNIHKRVTLRAPSEEQTKELSERLKYKVSADQVSQNKSQSDEATFCY